MTLRRKGRRRPFGRDRRRDRTRRRARPGTRRTIRRMGGTSARYGPPGSVPARDLPLRHPLRQFLLVSVALGVVVAAMALPIVGSSALAARNAARSFENLPSILDAPP